MEHSFACVGLLLCISLASAQLTYHLDANTNSYTLQTPNSQQTFTQHFNTRNGANQLQAAQSQQQQQIYATSPQQFAGNQNNGQDDINNYFRQQLELQQQQRLQDQQNNLYTTYQAPQQQRQAAQPQSAQDLGIFYQQFQQAQQQQQQQAELPAQQAFAYQPQGTGFTDSRGAAQFAQYQPQTPKYQEQQATQNLLGTHFSPSNEVSHVKFTSGDLSYNF